MSLNEKLEAALESRRRRNILRRLPSPTRSDSVSLVDFVSNDYLSLTSYAPLRKRVLAALQAEPAILGSGGSRLLVNPAGHQALEERLCTFFDAPSALLFNSGFDANASFFASVPQEGDVAVYDEYIHASVHDGLRVSRLARPSEFSGKHQKALFSFQHNSTTALRALLLSLLEDPVRGPALESGSSSVFVAVEALYSMDGTLAPLPEIVDVLEELLPRGNGRLIVDEAHSTGLYGPAGRGLVAHWGLERRVFARLHTFGKALASSGAVVLTSQLVKDYLLNYARPLIYTTALSCATVVAANCSFDILEDGTATNLADDLQKLARYALSLLQRRLASLPPDIASLPPHLIGTSPSSLFSPIIPIMSPTPRLLSAYLRELGLNARPISWPTVPKARTVYEKEDIDRLVDGVVSWTCEEVKERLRRSGAMCRTDEEAFIEAKL
ncbi:PLP-dependent transferase [Phellopilus nigrolimitatus]|nr:PLP-dependent transferase [Phellopilus nigrolimitatus]